MLSPPHCLHVARAVLAVTLSAIIACAGPSNHRSAELEPSAAAPDQGASRDQIARPPLSDAEVLEAFGQSVSTLTLEHRKREDVSPSVFPSLGAMAVDRTFLASCDAETCSGATVHARLPIRSAPPNPPHWPSLEPFTEIALMSFSGDHICTWAVVARTAQGWLDPIQLGTSALGCKVPLDQAAIEANFGLWFPLSMKVDGDALRVDAQALDEDSLLQAWDDETKTVTIARRHEVVLCRLHPFGRGTLACSTMTSAAPPLTATFRDALREPILPAGSPALPFATRDTVGLTHPASWHIAPVATKHHGHYTGLLTERMTPYSHTRVIAHELGPDRPTVLVFPENLSLGMLHNGRYVELSSRTPKYENDTFEIVAVAPQSGVVRVDFSRTLKGPTSVTWTWSELVTHDHHIILATGVDITVDGVSVTAWKREIDIRPDGLTLRSTQGNLAWFRGTGHFTWEALVPAVARWRLAFARAWETVRDEPTRFPAASNPDAKIRDKILAPGRLVTIPGFAEPMNWTVVDTVIPISAFE